MKWLSELIELIYQLFRPIFAKEHKANEQLKVSEKVKEAEKIIKDLNPSQRDAVLKRLHNRDRRHNTNSD